MRKIPTIFKRGDDHRITREYAIDPELFLNAVATEKLDGMNVRVTVRNHTAVRLEKRLNPTKLQKAKGITEPWYTDANEFGPEDKWLYDALNYTHLSNVLDGEWSGEALGPNIQGNPLNLPFNRIVFFSLHQAPLFQEVPTTYDELQDWLPKQKSKYGTDCGIEGIVWHCPSGEMMKIKTRDFLADTR